MSRKSVARQFRTIALAGLAVLAMFSIAGAQEFTEAVFADSSAQAGAEFGAAVDIDGEWLIVGAPGDSTNGPEAGAVYFYRQDGTDDAWEFSGKLVPQEVQSGDSFGYSVAISGDHAVAGAWYDDDLGNNAGAVYFMIFTGEGWEVESLVTASDGQEGDHFGFAVDMHGERAIIGAYRDDDQGFNSGSAYIYGRSKSAWTETAKIIGNSVSDHDQFGATVSIHGDYAAAGSWTADMDTLANAGAVHVFSFDGAAWGEEALLNAEYPNAGEHFGFSVSIYGDRLLGGTFQDDDLGNQSGSAYVFLRDKLNGWAYEAHLFAGDGAAFDEFGNAVALNDSWALVAAHQRDETGANSGVAYLFELVDGTWSEIHKFIPTGGNPGAGFGSQLALSGARAAVGAPRTLQEGDSSGAAYIYAEQPLVTVAEPLSPALSGYALYENYPNPFNPETRIRFRLAEEGLATLEIYDLLGRVVRTLENSRLTTGEHQRIWNGRDDQGRQAPSGIYLARLTVAARYATAYVAVKRIALVR